MSAVDIVSNIANVQARIAAAELAAHRPRGSVCLLAVSKTKPASLVRAAAAAGLRAFGENYLQEGVDKISALADLDLVWHFIGPIQSNKTRPIAEHFDWVHSVDREKIARRLSEQRPLDRPPLNICLQVNISQEATKAGLHPDEVGAVAETIAGLPNLVLRGLMAIPAPAATLAAQRQPLAALHELQRKLALKHPTMDTLSMGMSGDLEAAIAEGSTIVRVGTDIFGARS
jgi:PLP dependent protein